MSREDSFHPERLRHSNYVCAPDPRSVSFAVLDDELGDFRPMEVRDNYRAIAEYKLNDAVPDDIVVHFDTARNLFVYAWFVYRFYPVAEHQVLSCLELALRERYEKEIPKGAHKRSKIPDLKALLRYAVDKGDVQNEGFKRWHEASERRAQTRYEYEKIQEMRDKGLSQIDLDFSEVKITDADRNLGYVQDLIKILPMFRNNYAHGNKMLHNQVLGTIQLVSEIINQIYRPAEKIAE